MRTRSKERVNHFRAHLLEERRIASIRTRSEERVNLLAIQCAGRMSRPFNEDALRRAREPEVREDLSGGRVPSMRTRSQERVNSPSAAGMMPTSFLQ